EKSPIRTPRSARRNGFATPALKQKSRSSALELRYPMGATCEQVITHLSRERRNRIPSCTVSTSYPQLPGRNLQISLYGLREHNFVGEDPEMQCARTESSAVMTMLMSLKS